MDALCQNDRRTWRRFAVPLAGRLFAPSGAAWRCEVLELSAGGARVQAPGLPAATAVTLYVARIGPVDAEVLEAVNGTLRLRFVANEARRGQISQLLDAMVQDGLARPGRARRKPRLATAGLHFVRADGETVACDALDLSFQGMSLRAPVRPPVGEQITIGGCQGRVVRHHDQGIVVQFGQAPAGMAPPPTASRPPIAPPN